MSSVAGALAASPARMVPLSDFFGLLLLVVLLFFGSAGWGVALVAFLRRAGWADAGRRINLGLRVCLGIALFLVIAGWLIALNTGWFALFVAWHLIGCLILVYDWHYGRRQKQPPSGHRPAISFWTAACLAAGFLAFLDLGKVMGNPVFNVNDDDAAYIYLASRLLHTGGLIDAFNLRRVTSLGGQTAYQAMFLRVAGNSAPQGFEFGFAALLLVLLVASGRKRNVQTVVACTILAVALLAGRSVGRVGNISPNFSAAALTLASYQVLTIANLADRKQRTLSFGLVGLLLASLLAIRFTFAIPVAVAVVAVSMVRPAQIIATLSTVFGVGALCVSGWAVASYRSSNTPMFPLLPGNYNLSWPGDRDPTADLHLHWSFLVTVLKAGDAGAVLVAVAIALFILAVERRRPSRSLVVLAAALLGSIAQVLIFVYEFSGTYPNGLSRYTAPSVLALGLFAVEIIWPKPSNRYGLPSRTVPAHSRSTDESVMRRRRIGYVAAGAGVATLVASMCGTSLPAYGQEVRRQVDGAVRVLQHPSRKFVDRYVGLRSTYDEVNFLIPRGAKVLAAVSFPSLLDFSKYRFATLDIPGSVSPPPHMPYFHGTSAKLEYLSAHDFTYIVADLPTTAGLYSRASWEADLKSRLWAYRMYAPYVLDWLSAVDQLARQPDSHRIGGVVVIPIPSPNRSAS